MTPIHRTFRQSIPSLFCGVPPHWPNNQTALTAVSIIVNIACQSLQSSRLLTVGLNAPIRVVMLTKAIGEQQYCKAAFVIAAFVALFFPHPYGRLASIGIDIISEKINFYEVSPLIGRASGEETTRLPGIAPIRSTTQHVLTFASIISIGACGVVEHFHYMPIINTPIRAMRIGQACYDKEYYRMFFDVPAFAVLFFAPPYGLLVSIGIDILSEMENEGYLTEMYDFYMTPGKGSLLSNFKNERLDPTDKTNACKILGITERQASDRKIVDKKFQMRKEKLEKQKERGSVSPFVVGIIQSLIDDGNMAYQTVCNHFPDHGLVHDTALPSYQVLAAID